MRVLGVRVPRCVNSGCQGTQDVRVQDVRVLRHASSGNQANEMLGIEMSEFWVSGYQDIIFTNKTNKKKQFTPHLTPSPQKKERKKKKKYKHRIMLCLSSCG